MSDNGRDHFEIPKFEIPKDMRSMAEASFDQARKAFEPPFLTLKAPDTDATGKSHLEWGGDIKDTSLPLRAFSTSILPQMCVAG